ncbi:putative TetR family transcriptional regulator [Microlunatus phosphovorus NM-1]|uniref:Putative TetR family transcriptional regulator n=1 Tax=Microlunatus phosphovorus (strain ATCC 700054 / DSM 10555 / JCM 9379 / NBRC 101784 / NCIMB 13414 / VKM Ac-1990 / NM-1) TaxID=1032480 RepID=F5XS34_MICPN|nr:putative TetR family transcriptional regulator [Microlunatus phosphovorus NM-1]
MVASSAEQPGEMGATAKRADVVRNQKKLLVAAAEVFATSGVDAPVREVAARAGVGMGTLYRHFPTRADLVVAVFRHQVEECAEAGPRLLAETESPMAALRLWIDRFVDFLITKHGLAAIPQADNSSATLHTYFLDRLLPVAEQLLKAAVDAGEAKAEIQPYELMRGIGNLCIAPERDPRYNPRRLIDLLLRGLQS